MNLTGRRFLFFLFLIPLVNSAQQAQDSLQVKEIALKAETDTDKDLSLELASEEIILITKTDLELLSAPGDAGTVTGKLEKGVQVQQLDIIGSYYLICYMGKCGYVPKESILKVHKSKLEQKKENDSLQQVKATKS